MRTARVLNAKSWCGLREGGGGGQHDVGVAAGLVEVGVDADHEVQGGEGLVEPFAVGCGQDRVGGDGDDGADRFAVVGGGVDLLGERGERQFAFGLGVPGDA
ncbi:hypothetical protein GCM10020256_62510 [Streptomyces thermocoprophilus]